MKDLYKVIIADDEFIIRDGLMSFTWESLGFRAIGAASNGKMVLEIMETEQADLIISDIKMPVMDGLELSKRVLKKCPTCKIVLLTGHKDFEYAKTAISIGVADYILKPIDLREFETLIRDIRGKLDEERETFRLLNTYEKQIQELMPIAEKTFFKDLLEGEIQDSFEIEEKLNMLELSLNQTYFSCGIFQFETSEATIAKSLFSAFTTALNEYFEENPLGYYFYNDNREVIIVFNFDVKDPKLSSYDFLESQVRKVHALIKEHLKSFGDSSIGVGVGNIYRSVFSLSTSYQQSRRALKRRYFIEDKEFFFSWSEKSAISKSIGEYPYEKEKELLNAIMEGDLEQSAQCLNSFWREFNPVIKLMEPADVQNIIIQFFSMLERKINKFGTSMESLAPLNMPLTEFIHSIDTMSGLKSWVVDIVYKITESIHKLNNSVKTTSFQAIQLAIKYINENYNKKITLNQVAEQVYLNPCYLSVQFKKETGKNFMEYIKECRIEKAKELLKQIDLKIYAVSETVGYQNPKYFTDTFKEYTGLTPVEYRQKIIFS